MKYYQLSNRQTSSRLANDTVILDHKDGIYFSLNEVGTHIWEQLKESPKSEEELTDSLLEAYEIDSETANQDLKEILNQLINEKLVEEVK